jgi:ribosomal protein L11 methyltransferase
MKQANGGTLYVVRLETNTGFGEVVETGLEAMGIDMVLWQAEDTDRVVFREYFGTDDEAAGRRAQLSAALGDWSDGDEWSVPIETLAGRDWEETWKEFFRVERVSRRIVVKPRWEAFDSSPGDCVVELTPGMAFGTGRHATTRACLRFLDEDATEGGTSSLLDLGCGTGILSIAAAKLGYGPILAVDCDPEAARTCRANAESNGVASRIEVRETDLADFEAGRKYDMVVANILANVLREHAAIIVSTLAPGVRPRLVLAGILATQFGELASVYAARGLVLERRITEDEWTSGCFRRR